MHEPAHHASVLIGKRGVGNPATGKAIEVHALALMRVDGDKVTELWAQFDQMGLLQQLGAIPGK